MATLTLLHTQKRITGRLGPCVLIGRKPFNHVALNHPTVSRLHAWILHKPEGYFISPAGGQNPTRLNGQPIASGQWLRDGDVIGIGPAKLVFRIADAPSVDQQWDKLPPMPAIQEDGILFQCTCKAPAWVPSKLKHAMLKCRHCHTVLKTPAVPDQAAGLAQAVADARNTSPVAPISSVVPKAIDSIAKHSAPGHGALGMDVVCSVCQSPLLREESITECPDCGLTFHEECWTENKGCSAYGCKQVGILDPDVQAMAHATTPSHSDEAVHQALEAHAQAQAHTPWEFLFLALSLLSMAIAAPTFGIPSLAVGILAIRYLHRQKKCHTWAIVLCVILSCIGLMGGAWGGWVWWYDINLNMP